MSEESVESIFQHACEGAAESIGSTRVDWQRVVDAIRFLRGRLESSEDALQEAQRALFRWLPNRIGSEYDDLIAADAMALMGLESTEGLREVGNEILVELMEKRRLLDDARAQKPVGDYGVDGKRVPLYAAPVPAQPAAVPEAVANIDNNKRAELIATVRWDRQSGDLYDTYRSDGEHVGAMLEELDRLLAKQKAVAKDAAAILVQALEEIAWQRPLGVRPSKSGEAMERAAIIALHKYNALLSAADTEVKK